MEEFALPRGWHCPVLGFVLVVASGLVASGSTDAPQAEARQRAQAAQAAPPPSEYVLAPGDAVTVKFYYAPELNESALPIRPDGKTSLQIVGDVQAAGLTVSAFRAALQDRYHGVLKNPELNVVVAAFESQKVYVGGQVGRPGVIPLLPGMTALQAIFAAGGQLRTGGMGSVVVVRNDGTPQPALLMVDLKTALSAGARSADLPLRARDIVFVPQSRIARINQFMDQYVTQLLPITKNFNLNYNFGTYGIAPP
jgi:protein involved in polysaccharide export with SLBB domain